MINFTKSQEKKEIELQAKHVDGELDFVVGPTCQCSTLGTMPMSINLIAGLIQTKQAPKGAPLNS